MLGISLLRLRVLFRFAELECHEAFGFWVFGSIGFHRLPPKAQTDPPREADRPPGVGVVGVQASRIGLGWMLDLCSAPPK